MRSAALRRRPQTAGSTRHAPPAGAAVVASPDRDAGAGSAAHGPGEATGVERRLAASRSGAGFRHERDQRRRVPGRAGDRRARRAFRVSGRVRHKYPRGGESRVLAWRPCSTLGAAPPLRPRSQSGTKQWPAEVPPGAAVGRSLRSPRRRPLCAYFARDATVASTSREYGCVEPTGADIGSNGWQPRSKPVG